MRVLFIYTVSNATRRPAKPIAEWIEISFGVSYLAAALKRAGHEVELLVLRHGGFRKEVRAAIERFDPLLVCFTAVATEFPLISSIGDFLRRLRPDLYQAIGGAHPTLRPDDAIAGSFDCVCIGEGEAALVELAEALARGHRPTGIENLWLKQGGTVEKNPTRAFQADIDSIPFPDREIWVPWVEENPKHTVLIARGCPFDCTYCSNHALWDAQPGKYVRFRSVENVMQELRELCARFPDAVYCYFEVETISADESWAKRFAAALEELNRARAVPMEFAINLRVLRKHSFRELFDDLSRAGFSYLRIGIESGSERVRREVLKRMETNAELTATFEDADRSGLQVFSYNLIGLPGETPEDFLETIEINRHRAVTRSYLSIFYPYPGTELERVCAERGIHVPPLEDAAERYRARLDLPEFPNRRIEYYFRRFSALVTGRQKPLLERVDEFAWRTIRGYPRLERLAQRLTGHGVMSRLKRFSDSVRTTFSPSR